MKTILNISLAAALAASAYAAPDSDFDYDVLALGSSATVVCANENWRVAVYASGEKREVEVVIDFAGRTIAQNLATYSVGMGKRSAVYRIDLGMGNLVTLRFPNRTTGRGQGDFHAFDVYDIPSLSCETVID